jgi:hypothetical protein
VDEIALPEGFYDLGQSFWLSASTIGGGGPCHFINYTLAFALQLRKRTENLSQGSVWRTSPCLIYACPSSMFLTVPYPSGIQPFLFAYPQI